MSDDLLNEWLEPDGQGGFACGTFAGEIRRFWHGLAWVAQRPPTRRVRLVAGCEERLTTGEGHQHTLTSTLDEDGQWRRPDLTPTVSPHPVTTWRWRLPDGAILERQLLMPRTGGVTLLRYEYTPNQRTGLRPAPGFPVRLSLRLILGHDCGLQAWPAQGKLGRVEETTLHVTSDAALHPGQRNASGPHSVVHATELDCEEEPRAKLWFAPEFAVDLAPGQPVSVALGREPYLPSTNPVTVFRSELHRRSTLRSPALQPELRRRSDGLGRRLARAADAFIVKRYDGRHTIMAGYPWFTDWGRDTMIALPGLCLATGRADEARSILAHFLAHLDRGVIPNLFPESGQAPQFNTIDATLWLFEAAFLYGLAYDPAFLRQQLPAFLHIVDWHLRGTHQDIRVEPDGLLRGGSPGSQLTWMDVKVNGHVPTPRHGKPVEIQGLWYNALMLLFDHAAELGLAPERTASLLAHAELCRQSFARRFVLPGQDHLADVVDRDGEGTLDASVRPNMVIPFGVRNNIIPPDRRAGVLRSVVRNLYTARGLRSLAPGSPGYCPIYRGDRVVRDHAYHQGTVWMWLMAPLVAGVRRNAEAVPELAALLPEWRQSMLEHFEREGCLDNASEIFDAEAPHLPRGCFAQAWSLAALIEAFGGPGALEGTGS